jgi:acetyl esterase/lipase
MAMTFDPEIAAVLAAAAAGGAPPVPERGDAKGLRAQTDVLLEVINDAEPDSPEVTTADFAVPVGDGASVLARWYTKEGSRPGSAVVYVHGGGMICGSVPLYDRLVARYVQATGVPFLSVDYRLSPEYPGTTLVDDSYKALTWFHERAGELGVGTDRVAVMGDSGGGGVAAGLAIAARDGGTPVAKQILIYPMLDDRNIAPDPEIAPFAVWTYDNNFTGWNALLGDQLGRDGVSPLAAPSRLTDFHGLAPAFIDVGELDIFRDESIAYAVELMHAGVSAELHVRPGAPHGFDRLARDSAVARRAWKDVVRVIESV